MEAIIAVSVSIYIEVMIGVFAYYIETENLGRVLARAFFWPLLIGRGIIRGIIEIWKEE